MYILTYVCIYVYIPSAGLYVLAEDLQQSLLDHYERADFEMSLPAPGRIGAVRNMPVVKSKGDLEISIEDHKKNYLSEHEVVISYKVCVKVCTCVYHRVQNKG